MKRVVSFLLLLSLLALSGCGFGDKVGSFVPGFKQPPEVAHETDGQKVYFVVEERGMRRSVGYRIRRQSTFRGQPCIVNERVTSQEISREGQTFSTTIRRKVIEAVGSGAALSAHEVRISGSERYQESVTISGGKASFETITPGGTDRFEMTVPQGIMFGIGPDWLVQQDLAPGKTFQKQVLSRKKREILVENVTVVGTQLEAVAGEEKELWVVEFANAGGSTQRMYFTKDGRFVRFKDDDLVVRIVSQEEAEKPAEPVAIVTTVPLDFELPAWDFYSNLVYVAEPSDDWVRYIRDSGYVSLMPQSDGSLQLVLARNAPRLQRPKLPMDVPPSLQVYLQKSEKIMPHKIQVIQQARRIVRNETDALRAVALIAGWVNQRIRFQNAGSLNPSPVETITSRCGDCSEHAYLFASLARAVGIPTRHCQGLLIQKKEAVYHAWVEAWVGGVWVPVDTTVNRVGLPAGYLLTARGTGDGIPKDEFAWRLRRGGLKLSLLKAIHTTTTTVDGLRQKRSYALIPNRKQTYLALEEDWLANIYWGFSVKRPANWGGRVNKSLLVSLTSDDKQARVVCEGLHQRFRADNNGLDMIVASLQENMDNFRKIDARILPFGSRRKQQALLVDFTTAQKDRRLRCRQYIVPKRGRSYRIAIWASEEAFKQKLDEFDAILKSIEL